MIREAIAKLTKKEDLTYEEARGVMEEMMDGTATQAQMGGLLMALSMQGETIDEITAFAEVMREKGVKIKPEREVIDIVGTGGDQVGTFNISTTSAFVVAAGGVPVAKHGNRSVSSRSGAADVLEKLGVDVLVECQLNDRIRHMKAENFIKEILMGDLGASYVVVGEDNRFGFERKGTPRLLMEFGEKYGFDVEILSKEMDGHRKISSTYIREELKKGNMEKVTSLMGRDYFVEGQVVHGRGMGHKVLLPTTNLVPPRTKILPPNGVYVTSSYFGDKIYHGITNIGCKPTVGESFIGVETYLFDCKEDLYGEECRVDFKKFLRPERKFPSLEALKSRLLADAEDGRRFFEKTEK